MLQENIKIIQTAYTEFKGTGMYIALYIIALLYILIKEENKNKKTLLGIYSILTIFF